MRINFSHPQIRQKFTDLGLEFLHIRMGRNQGWVVNSRYFPNEHGKFIINYGSTLTEIHREYLVFEMDQQGVKVTLKVNYKRL